MLNYSVAELRVKKEGGLAQTEWEIVAKKPAAVQVIASASDYIVDGNQTQFTFTVAQAAELIGTESAVLGTLQILSRK